MLPGLAAAWWTCNAAAASRWTLDRRRTGRETRLMLVASALARRVSYERESTGNRNVVHGGVLRGEL